MEEKKRVLNINLDKFIPREYQIPILRAYDEGYKRFVIVMHRRAGKDLVGFNLMLYAALERVGTYFYILPTYKQAKKIIWKGMTKDGTSFLDYIPNELIKKKHQQDLSIELINGSIISLIGSNKYDSLRGTGAVGIVFSEYAYQHPSVYPTIRPVIIENDGWMLFQSTPFGENHFFDIYKVAKQNPDIWFSYLQTVDDTGVITPEQIKQEIKENLISPDMVQQEYYCDFTVGAQGSYYATYVNELYLKEQIGEVEWDKGRKVNTAWDIGMDDETIILFWQFDGRAIKIIDMYANRNVGLDHYAQVVLSKPYVYGTHVAPFDIKVRDQSYGGLSRWDKMESLGIRFEIAKKLSIIDGIETVRSQFNRFWIDEVKCKKLISALRDYRKEYDEKLKKYKNTALHDHNSHPADALRYLCIHLPFMGESMTELEAEEIRREALYGTQDDEVPVFRERDGFKPGRR